MATFSRIIAGHYPNTWLVSGVCGDVASLLGDVTAGGRSWSFSHYCEVGHDSASGHTLYQFTGVETA